jgi:hypothetical protein
VLQRPVFAKPRLAAPLAEPTVFDITTRPDGMYF